MIQKLVPLAERLGLSIALKFLPARRGADPYASDDVAMAPLEAVTGSPKLQSSLM